MKKLFAIVLIAAFLIASIATAKQIDIEFGWTPNTEPDVKQYVVFHRVEGQGYSYEIPVKIIPCTVTDGACVYDPADAIVSFEVADGALVLNHFTLRAEDTEQNQSGDSNECHITVDFRTIPAATMLQGIYNDVLKTIDFTWSQPEQDRVARWDLLVSQVSGTGYVKTGEFNVPTGTWEVPDDGEYYFTIIPFTKIIDTVDETGTIAHIADEVYAVNSNEAYVQVKEHPSPVKNFKVKIRIK